MAATVITLGAEHTRAYRALMLHAYEHAADSFTSTPQERSLETTEWWLKRIVNPHGLTVAFGGIDAGEIVGTVALEFSAKPKTRHKALVIGMYVLPQARGSGLARQLLQAAIDFCRARGDLRLMQLEVTQGNEAATSLYPNMGFEPFGLEPLAVLTPQGYRSKVHMWLDLDTL